MGNSGSRLDPPMEEQGAGDNGSRMSRDPNGGSRRLQTVTESPALSSAASDQTPPASVDVPVDMSDSGIPSLEDEPSETFNGDCDGRASFTAGGAVHNLEGSFHVEALAPPCADEPAKDDDASSTGGGVPPLLLAGQGSLQEYDKSDDNLNLSSSMRRSSFCTDDNSFSESSTDDDDAHEFSPAVSRDNEWMGRSIESLILGHLARAPILSLTEEDGAPEEEAASAYYVVSRRRSTASTFGGEISFSRRGSTGSFAGSRRGSLSLLSSSSNSIMHGGTMANYYNRRRPMPTEFDRSHDRPGRRGSTAHGPSYRGRRNSVTTAEDEQRTAVAGPNVALSLLAREMTGRSSSKAGMTQLQSLRAMGGHTLFTSLDKPAAGIGTEVSFLSAAIDEGEWAETQMIVSRIAPRLIGDPSAQVNAQDPSARPASIDDASLPPSASPFYAGGGRLGLERDTFVLSGGVEVLLRIFREKSFVGEEMAVSNDARDLGESLVATRLAPCWNETLASLRELIFAIPSLVEDGTVLDNGDFLPFLFTLLSHDSCFDGAAALIEEILSLMSHSPQPQPNPSDDDGNPGMLPLGRSTPVTTFFLGNVPNLYKLWGGFNCRQLAHFCRILALLVFEPEDRQLLESPAVLKSLELLQLRRNRAVRAGRDSTVDMNQAILLGDEELTMRLLKLLRVMNFAPSVRRSSPYHVMAHFPFIADTLVMLGLNEIENWEDIDRLEQLARKRMSREDENDDSEPLVSELGSVATMLENLSGALMGNSSEPANQLGQIIHVISAAQQAGVIVERSRQGRSGRRSSSSIGEALAEWNQEGEPSEDSRGGNPISMVGVPVYGTTIRDLATAAGMLPDPVLVRGLYRSNGQLEEENQNDVQVLGLGSDRSHSREDALEDSLRLGRSHISSPRDAANALQFNALLLGPYQVEVLFVLCTLLGGRRKMDAQEKLRRCGVIPVLDDMFQRLPWYEERRSQSSTSANDSNGEGNSAESADEQQGNGIHGPGCECTPESALCVQYLRLLHNFCDRDCDNYSGRHNLLSPSERAFVFKEPGAKSSLKPGLLSKIVDAFVRESDESPYRFWLASCIESYLRGSSPAEQLFVARSGLLMHLIEDITSERLHCAGSLQTSFDLLGELCKGNHEVLGLLVSNLNEESFRKFMSVAAANLVDSNVFIRSLWLTLERLSAANRQIPLHFDSDMSFSRQSAWTSYSGPRTRYYLTHSWWDSSSIAVDKDDEKTNNSDFSDVRRPSDWFPTIESVEAGDLNSFDSNSFPSIGGLDESVGHFGWVFSPVGEGLTAASHEPNTMERLSWFLAANQARLLRDLLGVVDLRNINHENICCLNTAVVIAIFAYRRNQLPNLLNELSSMNDEEKESKRRAIIPTSNDDLVDRAFVQALRYLDIEREAPSYARRASISNRPASSSSNIGSPMQIGDRTDVMRNFREVLWFWFEYYTHRGRDRLSLEFSSHLRFQEWMQVVSLLVADDTSPSSLVRSPVRLPRSPYQSAARIAENPMRGN